MAAVEVQNVGGAMATVKVRHSYTFQDELGSKAALTLYAVQDDGDLVSDVSTEWSTIGALLNAASGGTIIGGESCVVEPAIAAGGVSKTGGRVEQTGLFNYLVTASGRHHGIAVPAYLNSLITAGKVPNAGATATLSAALTGALAHGAGVMDSSDWLALGDLADISLTFRKRGNLLSRSREVF